MIYRRLTPVWVLGLVATASAIAQTDASAQTGGPVPAGAISAPLNPEDVDAYGEELLRGPVHEAFAEQYSQDPIAGITIDRAPPPQVNEIPPEIRPEGDNVQWLSGYWFWDDDRSDFLWVSGTWRVIPPGQRWLPGYWAESNGQHQWVSGSWVSTQQEAIQYIAQSPPESLDNGPTGIAPSENHFWIPGCWTWTQNDYAWRPGYWSGGYSNWVWVPQRYLWTPRGYVFCSGYWDYPIARRGTLFAPFYFNQPVYARSNFFYSPRVSILASLLQSHFWVRPHYHHYYFGDFYASNYRNAGIIPWHSYHRGVGFQSRRYSFDPLFVHANLFNRSGGGNFYQEINNQYNIFVNQSDRRPSLTYRDQLQRGDRERGRGGFNDDRFNRGPSVGDRNESLLGESIRDLAQRQPDRFTRLTTEQITRVRDQSRDIPNLTSLRRENETWSRGRDIGTPGRQALGSDRQSPVRDSAERDEPGRSADRGNRGTDSLAGQLQLPPVDRVRFGADRQTESDRPRSEGRYSAGRPEIERPGGERPRSERSIGERPSVAIPGGDRPSINRPAFERPRTASPGAANPAKPGTGRPGRDVRSGVPLDGSRIGDEIRDRVPQVSRPIEDRSSRESGRTLPGIGTSPTRPQIGAPSSQPLRTPGYGERSSGRVGGPTLAPNEAGRPSAAVRTPSLGIPMSGDSSTSLRSGPPSTSLRSGPPSTSLRSAPPSTSLRSAPPSTSLRSGTPSTGSRAQFTPQTRGGARPDVGPSARGNRGGGDAGDGGRSTRGKGGKRD